MSDIFTYESQDIDLKESIKLRTNCQQSDTVVLQFNVFNYDIPVDLTNFNIMFVAKKPDGTVYTQVENMTKTGNLITMNCNSQLTATTGKVTGILTITDNLGNRKSSYFIVLNVTGLVSDEDRVVSRNFVDILEHFDDDISIALVLSEKFKEDIEQANIEELEIKENIAKANTTKSLLKSVGDSALVTKDELDESINEANNASAEANVLISNLTSLNSSSQTTKSELINTLANADTKLQEFKDYDTTNLVPLSNQMLNELYCNNELVTINHGLNDYPIVQLIFTEYGAGIGGAGDYPAGGESEANTMQNRAVYLDNNNLKLYVSNDYYVGETPIIEKINDYKYIITYTISTKSIIIKLKI